MDSGCFRMPFEIIREGTIIIVAMTILYPPIETIIVTMTTHHIDIEQNLRIKYQKLRDRMTYLKEQTDTDTGSNVQSGSEDDEKRVDLYETEIDELMKQLNNYQEIITQQEELIVVRHMVVGVVHCGFGDHSCLIVEEYRGSKRD